MSTPPKDPSFFDKTNYVIDSWAQPCEAPWYIYIETMGPAALEAFITLITFGWDDVARGYFRPRGLYKRRSGKRKGKWAKRVPRFPEIGEEIGKRIPGADRQKGKKWSELGKTLWRIDGVIQQGLFWWLVVDVTNDFFFNWTSVLYETEWCKASNRGRFSWQTIGDKIIPGGTWHALIIDAEDYTFAFPNWLGSTGFVGVKGAVITSAMQYRPFPGFPPPTGYETRMINLNTGEVYGTGSIVVPDASGVAQNLVNFGVGPNRRFSVQGRHNGTWAYYYDGMVTGIENL